MRKVIFVSLVAFFTLFVFLPGLLPADDIMEKMLEPIPDEAIKALLTKYPDDARMHLGAAFLFTEDKNKAETKERAIKLAPTYKKILLIQDLTRSPYYRKFDEEDLKKLEELVKIDPGNAWPHYLLAGYYLKKGEKERWLREVDEALSKERFDDYEVERLHAIFRVLDEINPPLKAFRKIHHYLGAQLIDVESVGFWDLELVRMGKRFEEKGENTKALEYYRKAERIGQQLLLKRPDWIMTRVASIQIRKMAYKEMARFYEEEGRVIKAAALREQIEFMDAWIERLREARTKWEIFGNPIRATATRLAHTDLEDIRLEKRQDIKGKVEGVRKSVRELLDSPEYTTIVDKYLEKLLTQGEIEARKILPEEKESPIARYREQLEKDIEALQLAIDQSLEPESLREICKSNLKQIGLACLKYAADHNGEFPPYLEALPEQGYIEKEAFAELIRCPKTVKYPGRKEEVKYKYGYLGAGQSTKKVKGQDRTIIAFDHMTAHGGGANILFMDGQVEWVPYERFDHLLADINLSIDRLPFSGPTDNAVPIEISGLAEEDLGLGARVSPDGSNLAISIGDSSPQGEQDIWIVDAATGQRRQFTSLPGKEYFPDWSPDGREIAFLHTSGFGSGIYVIPAEGGEPRLLIGSETTDVPGIPEGFGPVKAPRWSPDGQAIVFAGLAEIAGVLTPKIFIIDSGGKNLRMISDLEPNIQDIDPSWSPDGSKIVIWTRNRFTKESRLAIRSAEDGRKIRELDLGMAPVGSSWLPNGEWLIFVGVDREICAIRPEGGPVRKLTQGGGYFPQVIEGGKRIVFHSRRTGEYKLYTLDISDLLPSGE